MKLEENLHTIDAEYAHVTKEADFAGTEEFEATSALVKIIRDGDDLLVGYEGTALLPDDEVHRLGLREQVLGSC